MKKIITLFFTVLLVLSLTPAAFANDMAKSENSIQSEISEGSDEKEDIKEYIQEKIAPIVIGVITSVLALLGALGSIKKTLWSLKDSRDILSIAQSTFENELRSIKKELEDVPEFGKKLHEIKKGFENVKAELERISKILALAYSSDPNLVKSGKATKMYKLIDENSDNGVSEIEK